MAAAMTPQQFAEKFIPVASLNQWWMGLSEPSLTKPNLFNPDSGVDQTVGRDPDKESSWLIAVKSALKAANPFAGQSVLSDGVGQATAKVGDQAANMIKAGADAVHNAGEGIASGFKWATFIVFFGLALYIFLLVAPFIPKPSGGR